MSDATRAEVCAVALAECFRGDGELLASAIGVLPTLGARLAKLTFAPEILITDGLHSVLAEPPPLGPANGFAPVVETWLPYRLVFDWLWAGRRHVVMGATQIDRFGNQNIACIGDPKRPRAQLLGMRGAPGNTIHHATSYWIPNHGPKSFVAKVDCVSGLGYDRAAALGAQSARFHEIRLERRPRQPRGDRRQDADRAGEDLAVAAERLGQGQGADLGPSSGVVGGHDAPPSLRAASTARMYSSCGSRQNCW